MYRRLNDADTTMPVTLEQIKLHLRIVDPTGSSPVPDNPEDPLLEAFIASATEEAEKILCLSLREKTFYVYGQDDATLNVNDLAPIVSVAGPYEGNTLLTGYTLEHDKAFPETVTVTPLPTETNWYVRVTCGYPDADEVPGPIKHWIKMRVGAYYENREGYKSGTIQTPMDFVPQLLWPYRNRNVY